MRSGTTRAEGLRENIGMIEYFKPSDGVKESDVYSGKLLEEEEPEQYEQRFPTGWFGKSTELAQPIAVFISTLFRQLDFVFFHYLSKLSLRRRDFD